MYFTYQAFIDSVATLASLLTMDLMKDLMMQIIGQEQYYFGLLQCTLISILLYLSHLLQNKTLYLPYPKYWNRYLHEQTVHTQIRSSLIMVYTYYYLTFDLHSGMHMYALMKHADHFFRQLCQ